jgi:uncharacterized membrane protein YbaN (DUF454 family)
MERNPSQGAPAAGHGTTRFAFCGARALLIVFGWLNVALGAIGVVVPGMPTTVFLLIALWAFSKCSARFHGWLYNHKTLGPPIRDWHERRMIPARAKVAAVAMMTLSVTILALFVAESWLLPGAVAACLVPVAAFILTRPSRPVA